MTSMMSSSDTSMKMKNNKREYSTVGLKVITGGVLVMSAIHAAPVLATPGEGAYEVVHQFSLDNSEGANPGGTLFQASDGWVYGTTDSGGAKGCGVVFRLKPEGDFNVAGTFNCDEYGHPFYRPGDLAEGDDGYLYGLATNNATYGETGEIYRLPLGGGSIATVYNMGTETGSNFFQGLTKGLDGAFYGLAASGGVYGSGTAFKLTAAGDLTVLASFDYNASVGGYPISKLVQASEGTFYSFTSLSSNPTSSNSGVFFSMTSTGETTPLQSFIRNDNYANYSFEPYCSPLIASDGQIYCTATLRNSDSGNGSSFTTSVFKVSIDGVFTEISQPVPGCASDVYSFSGSLIEASDGTFYGTTVTCGSSGRGNIYKITPDGKGSSIIEFTDDESGPFGQLIQAKDGNLYGTLYISGGSSSNGPGLVFRYLVPTAAPTSVVATASASRTATLSWVAPKYATSYNVYQATATGAEGNTPVQTGLNGTTATVSGLTIGTTYFFQVSAVHDGVESLLSTEVSTTPPAAVPTGLTATAGDNKVTLSWTASSGATSYSVYQSQNAGGEGATPVLTGVTGTSATISNLVAGTKYYFTVSAVAGSAQSAQSAEVSATTNAAPASSGGGAFSPLIMLALGLLSRRRPMLPSKQK